MLRTFVISLFIVITSWTFAANMNDINYIRKEFNVAIEDAAKAKKLYDQLQAFKPSKKTLQYAYLGATEALLAKHSYNPFSKLSYVNSALNKLNKSVELNSQNIEIRYMRFSVEANMPAYLGYNKHIEDDKQNIIKELTLYKITIENSDMYKIFANGIINSNYCNKEDKLLLSKVVDACDNVKHSKN
jgi:hypothetical protein